MAKLAFIILLVIYVRPAMCADNVIEKQLEEIGKISDEEVVVVQRKFTRKVWRSELTPLMFGGVPFGTVRRTLFAGASYSLHASDWLSFELINFNYIRSFFSSFTDDINQNKDPSRIDPSTGTSTQPDIKPDYQKLLYILTTGITITPFYGKLSTFSRWVAYVEPFFSLGVGLAKTEGTISIKGDYFCYYPGIGLRVFFREWVSFKVEFRDYLYTEKFIDRGTGLQTQALRNNYAVMLALSFWLPKMPR